MSPDNDNLENGKESSCNFEVLLGKLFSSKRIASSLIVAGAITLYAGGVLGILAYTFSTWHRFGTGIMVLVASTAVGLLAGLLLGVPRAISSGQIRQTAIVAKDMARRMLEKAAVNGANLTSDERSRYEQTLSKPDPRYASSSNLAEVSDWLTKLLLGAGIVSIARLGGPIGGLLDSVAAGLAGAKAGSMAPGKIVAGSVLFGYVALGILAGYMITTLWYGKKLDEL